MQRPRLGAARERAGESAGGLPGLRSTQAGRPFRRRPASRFIEILIAAGVPWIAAIAGRRWFGRLLAHRRRAVARDSGTGRRQVLRTWRDERVARCTVATGFSRRGPRRTQEVAWPSGGNPAHTVERNPRQPYVPTGGADPQGNQELPDLPGQAPLIPPTARTSTVERDQPTHAFSTYVTNYGVGRASPLFAGRVPGDASVSWPKSPQRPGALSSDRLGSPILYAPQGCLSNGTHPFRRPRQGRFSYGHPRSTGASGRPWADRGPRAGPSRRGPIGPQKLHRGPAGQAAEEGPAIAGSSRGSRPWPGGVSTAGGGRFARRTRASSAHRLQGGRDRGFLRGQKTGDPGSVAATSGGEARPRRKAARATRHPGSSGGGAETRTCSRSPSKNATAGGGSMTADGLGGRPKARACPDISGARRFLTGDPMRQLGTFQQQR